MLRKSAKNRGYLTHFYHLTNSVTITQLSSTSRDPARVEEASHSTAIDLQV